MPELLSCLVPRGTARGEGLHQSVLLKYWLSPWASPARRMSRFTGQGWCEPKHHLHRIISFSIPAHPYPGTSQAPPRLAQNWREGPRNPSGKCTRLCSNLSNEGVTAEERKQRLCLQCSEWHSHPMGQGVTGCSPVLLAAAQLCSASTFIRWTRYCFAY